MKKLFFLLVTFFFMNGAIAQWFPQSSGTNHWLRSVIFTDDNTGYIVGDSGTILKTTNCGDQWFTLNSGTNNDLRFVNFNTPSTGYAVGKGVILKTEDAGATWINQTPPGLTDWWVLLSCVHFPVEDTGYVVGTDWSGWLPHGLFLKSVNGGSSWAVDTVFADTNSSLNAVFFLDANTGFVCGQKAYGETGPGLILKTINGGADWYEFTTVPAGFSTIYFTDADNGFAGCHYPLSNAGGLYRTSDGGNTWAGELLAFSPNSVFFPDAVTGFQVGWEGINGFGAIRKTTDAGSNWTSPEFITQISLFSTYFTDVLTGYVVGGGGVIYKTINGGTSTVNELPSSNCTFEMYPNPAESVLNLEISEPSCMGRATIANIQGQKLQEYSDLSRQMHLDISSLKSGIYFVRLQNEKSVVIKKLLKL